ncbi:MAG: hypothetical protein WC848_06845 [Parcubacteria group bacterium]
MEPLTLFSSAVSFMKDIFSFFRFIVNSIKLYINLRRPAGRIFGKLLKNKKNIKIYSRDFFVPNNTYDSPKLTATGSDGKQWIHPNIDCVWADVEVNASMDLIKLFAKLGKDDVLIEKMSNQREWDENVIILGAQADSSLKFYEIMKNVGYGMNAQEIYDKDSGEIIQREDGYGYGIILKAKNPHIQDECDFSYLIGGFGVLGTEAASLYFVKNLKEISEIFGKKYFGCIVRASIEGGKYSVERLAQYDKKY